MPEGYVPIDVFEQVVRNLGERIHELETREEAVGAWVTVPALGANWTNTTAVQYWRSANGIVYLKGRVTKAAGALSDIFTLPAGYRPIGSNADFAAAWDATLGRELHVQVSGGGIVRILNAVTPTTGTIIPLWPVMFPIHS